MTARCYVDHGGVNISLKPGDGIELVLEDGSKVFVTFTEFEGRRIRVVCQAPKSVHINRVTHAVRWKLSDANGNR